MSILNENEWREILTAQALTAQEHKIARAEAVLAHRDLKTHEMWAVVELETKATAEAAWRADIEAKVLWAIHGADIVRFRNDENLQ